MRVLIPSIFTYHPHRPFWGVLTLDKVVHSKEGEAVPPTF